MTMVVHNLQKLPVHVKLVRATAETTEVMVVTVEVADVTGVKVVVVVGTSTKTEMIA